MTQRDILRRIIASTSQFILEIPAPPSHHVQNISMRQIPHLRLHTFISHFHSEMRRTGFLPQICKLASAKATELAQYYQKSYESACNDTLKSPRNGEEITEVIGSLRSTYETLYEKRDLPRFLSDALKAQDTYFNTCQHPSSTSSKVRPAFNQEYTPLLEKYFEYNAYPSSRDRLVLARQSMMTPRQIEVWFQNHRNRGKKEGVTLNRRTSNSLPFDFNLESLEGQTPSFLMPENQKNELDEQGSSDESLHEDDIQPLSRDAFSTSAPEHAYPTKYPPDHVHDPFPNQNGIFKFQPPQWRRKPATEKLRAPPISVDEITLMFASKLNLHAELPRRQNRQRVTSAESHRPWFAATVTTPCPAPLPALLYAPRSLAAQPAFPRPRTSSRSPEPSSFPNTISRSRKLGPLPRRIPKNFSPTSDTSSSRTSSLDSIASLQSWSTSSVSSIDALSPPISWTQKSQSTVLTHEQLKLLNGFFLPASNCPSPEVLSRHWGLSESWNDGGLNQIPLLTPA